MYLLTEWEAGQENIWLELKKKNKNRDQNFKKKTWKRDRHASMDTQLGNVFQTAHMFYFSRNSTSATKKQA